MTVPHTTYGSASHNIWQCLTQHMAVPHTTYGSALHNIWQSLTQHKAVSHTTYGSVSHNIWQCLTQHRADKLASFKRDNQESKIVYQSIMLKIWK